MRIAKILKVVRGLINSEYWNLAKNASDRNKMTASGEAAKIVCAVTSGSGMKRTAHAFKLIGATCTTTN